MFTTFSKIILLKTLDLLAILLSVESVEQPLLGSWKTAIQCF